MDLEMGRNFLAADAGDGYFWKKYIGFYSLHGSRQMVSIGSIGNETNMVRRPNKYDVLAQHNTISRLLEMLDLFPSNSTFI